MSLIFILIYDLFVYDAFKKINKLITTLKDDISFWNRTRKIELKKDK